MGGVCLSVFIYEINLLNIDIIKIEKFVIFYIMIMNDAEKWLRNLFGYKYLCIK